MSEKKKKGPEAVVREIKRQTRRNFTSEEKIRIVLEGLRGEESIATLCRREGINPNLYYRWSKGFLEGGKKRLSGDTQREATTDEVQLLRRENDDLKKLLAETFLKYEQFKKSTGGST
jgi:transposase